MIRVSFLGIIVSIFVLAAPGQVSAGVSKETIATPDNLTDMQKTEWDIGKFSGWLRLCGYGSKSSQISSFMKKSPYFRKAETKVAQYDMSIRCSSSNETLNQILGEKEEWIRYLVTTYSPQAKIKPRPQRAEEIDIKATAVPDAEMPELPDDKMETNELIAHMNPVDQFDGLWTGLGESESGNCQSRVLGRSFQAFELEIMVREQEITGRIEGVRNLVWNHFFVDVSIQGTVNENGEFDLQVGKNNLSADLVLRGKLPKEGDRANGKWNTPNCHGKLTLNRDFRSY